MTFDLKINKNVKAFCSVIPGETNGKSGGLVRTGTSGGDLLEDSVSILTPPLTLLSILQVDAGLLSTADLTLLTSGNLQFCNILQ